MRARRLLALTAAGLLLAGCDTHDRIRETQDPCLFLLDFAPRCIPAGKTAICTHREPAIVRSTAPNCAKKDQ